MELQKIAFNGYKYGKLKAASEFYAGICDYTEYSDVKKEASELSQKSVAEMSKVASFTFNKTAGKAGMSKKLLAFMAKHKGMFGKSPKGGYSGLVKGKKSYMRKHPVRSGAAAGVPTAGLLAALAARRGKSDDNA